MPRAHRTVESVAPGDCIGTAPSCVILCILSLLFVARIMGYKQCVLIISSLKMA